MLTRRQAKLLGRGSALLGPYERKSRRSKSHDISSISSGTITSSSSFTTTSSSSMSSDPIVAQTSIQSSAVQQPSSAITPTDPLKRYVLRFRLNRSHSAYFQIDTTVNNIARANIATATPTTTTQHSYHRTPPACLQLDWRSDADALGCLRIDRIKVRNKRALGTYLQHVNMRSQLAASSLLLHATLYPVERVIDDESTDTEEDNDDNDDKKCVRSLPERKIERLSRRKEGVERSDDTASTLRQLSFVSQDRACPRTSAQRQRSSRTIGLICRVSKRGDTDSDYIQLRTGREYVIIFESNDLNPHRFQLTYRITQHDGTMCAFEVPCWCAAVHRDIPTEFASDVIMSHVATSATTITITTKTTTTDEFEIDTIDDDSTESVDSASPPPSP